MKHSAGKAQPNSSKEVRARAANFFLALFNFSSRHGGFVPYYLCLGVWTMLVLTGVVDHSLQEAKSKNEKLFVGNHATGQR